MRISRVSANCSGLVEGWKLKGYEGLRRVGRMRAERGAGGHQQVESGGVVRMSGSGGLGFYQGGGRGVRGRARGVETCGQQFALTATNSHHLRSTSLNAPSSS